MQTIRLRANEVALCLLLLCAVLSAACPGNPPPELKPLYTAEAVLIRVHELQTLAGNLFDKKELSPERTKLIVSFTKETAVVLQDSKAGWQESFKSGWTALKANLKTTEPQLETLFKVLDAMAGALQ